MPPINRLSALSVHHAKTPGYYSDGGGLVLQVSANGTKSWIFRYRFDGRRHEMGLGSCALVSLAKARELAQSCRQLIVQGSDPLAERRQVRAARHAERARHMTFDQCAAAYIQAHKSGWRNAKHADQWTRTLATYAAPVIGALPVGEVETDHVVKVLAPIWATKTETATRLRGRIESILDWATVSKFRQGENPARWRGHLDYLLAKPNKVTRVKNFPALPWPQVAALMAELRQREGVSAQALEFAILTAARSGEVRGARWDEVDLTRRLWTVPAERMKARREHRVPLSDAVIALLSGLPDREGLLFPGQKNQPLSDVSLSAVLRRMGPPSTDSGRRFVTGPLRRPVTVSRERFASMPWLTACQQRGDCGSFVWFQDVHPPCSPSMIEEARLRPASGIALRRPAVAALSGQEVGILTLPGVGDFARPTGHSLLLFGRVCSC